jgi:ribosomal protein S18 acetylase RimI-like enzyme
MKQCELRAPVTGDWPRIAELLADSIPNALVSRLGRRFGAFYYRHLAEKPDAFSLAAFDGAGTLAGVIIGTLDRQRSRRLPFGLKLRLIAAAHFRLLSPGFLRWLTKSRRTATRPETAVDARPQAELLAIAVDSRFRGEQLASRLLNRMEAFFRESGLRQPYLILTEKTNRAANRFYKKTGARLACRNLYHGRQINEWHKTLA